MGIPKSSLNGSFPDNSEFQLTGKNNLDKEKLNGTAIEGKHNALTSARDGSELLGSTIMDNIVEPAVKSLASTIVGSIFDTIEEAIISVIYKNDPSKRPRGTSRYNAGGGGYASYGSIFDNYGSNNRGYNSDYYRYSSATNHQDYLNSPPADVRDRYSNIIFQDRAIADDFLDYIFEYVNQYKMISLGKVYSYLGWEYMAQDSKWGWTPEELNPSTVMKTRTYNHQWRVRLPKPSPIEI